MESILESIKMLLGIYDNVFDQELVMHINSAMAMLTQLGVGPEAGFKISGNSEVWADYIGVLRQDLDDIKMAVYMRVRLTFDPPQNSFLVDSLSKQLEELYWRIEVALPG